MQIDVIVDTVCPWCYIGKRRLDAGLALRSDLEFDVRYHPFLLAPDMPKEGRDRREYFKEKFGKNADLKKMSENMRREAGDIEMNLEGIKRVPNTIDSHRLIAWAFQHGVQDKVVDAVFKAYFTDGRDIGQSNVLVEIAEDVGLDGAQLSAVLASDVHIQQIRQAAMQASAMGINGVPFYIFDKRVALSGAQQPEVIAQAIDKALETAAA